VPFVSYTGSVDGLVGLENLLTESGFRVERGEMETTAPIVGPVIVRVVSWIEVRTSHRASAYVQRVQATKVIDAVKRRYQNAWIGLSFEDEDDTISMR
jgi:Holliday junction resolvase